MKAQEILKEMEDDFSRHLENGSDAATIDENGNAYSEGWFDCLEKYIPLMKLLLNEKTAKDLTDTSSKQKDACSCYEALYYTDNSGIKRCTECNKIRVDDL